MFCPCSRYSLAFGQSICAPLTGTQRLDFQRHPISRLDQGQKPGRAGRDKTD
jgi:hypothetical protein